MVKIKSNEISLVDITEPIPHPRNNNRHSIEQIAWLAKIIKHSGFREPINVSKRSGYVVAGHGRLEAAKYLNMDMVPVIYQDYESEEAEFQHMTADNEIARLAELDFQGLRLDIGDLDIDFSLDMLGLSIKSEDDKTEVTEAEESEKKDYKVCPQCGEII